VVRDEVRPAGHLLESLRLDAVLAEERLDVGDACLLVSRRVRRVELDQLAEEVDGVDHRPQTVTSRA
jgi:hypothetical protein